MHTGVYVCVMCVLTNTRTHTLTHTCTVDFSLPGALWDAVVGRGTVRLWRLFSERKGFFLGDGLERAVDHALARKRCAVANNVPMGDLDDSTLVLVDDGGTTGDDAGDSGDAESTSAPAGASGMCAKFLGTTFAELRRLYVKRSLQPQIPLPPCHIPSHAFPSIPLVILRPTHSYALDFDQPFPHVRSSHLFHFLTHHPTHSHDRRLAISGFDVTNGKCVLLPPTLRPTNDELPQPCSVRTQTHSHIRSLATVLGPKRVCSLARSIHSNRSNRSLRPSPPSLAPFSTGTLVYFSADTTPNMRVARAVRASSSIPFVFAPVQHDGHVYVDGGLMRRVPIDAFGPPDASTLALKLSKDFVATTPEELERMSVGGFASRVISSFVRMSQDLDLVQRAKLERGMVMYVIWRGTERRRRGREGTSRQKGIGDRTYAPPSPPSHPHSPTPTHAHSRHARTHPHAAFY